MKTNVTVTLSVDVEVEYTPHWDWAEDGHWIGGIDIDEVTVCEPDELVTRLEQMLPDHIQEHHYEELEEDAYENARGLV